MNNDSLAHHIRTKTFTVKDDIKPWLLDYMMKCNNTKIVIERSDKQKIIFKCKMGRQKHIPIGKTRRLITCPFKIRANFSNRAQLWNLVVINACHNHDGDEYDNTTETDNPTETDNLTDNATDLTDLTDNPTDDEIHPDITTVGNGEPSTNVNITGISAIMNDNHQDDLLTKMSKLKHLKPLKKLKNLHKVKSRAGHGSLGNIRDDSLPQDNLSQGNIPESNITQATMQETNIQSGGDLPHDTTHEVNNRHGHHNDTVGRPEPDDRHDGRSGDGKDELLLDINDVIDVDKVKKALQIFDLVNSPNDNDELTNSIVYKFNNFLKKNLVDEKYNDNLKLDIIKKLIYELLVTYKQIDKLDINNTPQDNLWFPANYSNNYQNNYTGNFSTTFSTNYSNSYNNTYSNNYSSIPLSPLLNDDMESNNSQLDITLPGINSNLFTPSKKSRDTNVGNLNGFVYPNQLMHQALSSSNQGLSQAQPPSNQPQNHVNQLNQLNQLTQLNQLNQNHNHQNQTQPQTQPPSQSQSQTPTTSQNPTQIQNYNMHPQGPNANHHQLPPFNAIQNNLPLSPNSSAILPNPNLNNTLNPSSLEKKNLYAINLLLDKQFDKQFDKFEKSEKLHKSPIQEYNRI